MQTFTAIVERDSETHLYVGYVPGFPGAHSQGETLDELQDNLRQHPRLKHGGFVPSPSGS